MARRDPILDKGKQREGSLDTADLPCPEGKYLIIFHGLGEGICCPLSVHKSMREAGPPNRCAGSDLCAFVARRDPILEKGEECHAPLYQLYVRTDCIPYRGT